MPTLERTVSSRPGGTAGEPALERGYGKRIALSIARAIHSLHAVAGVVHGDLRPSKGNLPIT